MQVGTADRHRQTRQPGTTADIDNAGALRNEVGRYGTVQQVALPQPLRLARPEVTVGHAVASQQFRVTLCYRHGVTEDRSNDLVVG